jgi:hypothetical protein
MVMSVHEMRDALKDANIAAVARNANVSYQVLLKIAKKEDYIPRVDMWFKLSDYLLKQS